MVAGVSLAPSHLARPKPPFLSFSNAYHHRQPRLCRSSLEFEFYRECRRTNKIRSNFGHNFSVIFAVFLGFTCWLLIAVLSDYFGHLFTSAFLLCKCSGLPGSTPVSFPVMKG